MMFLLATMCRLDMNFIVTHVDYFHCIQYKYLACLNFHQLGPLGRVGLVVTMSGVHMSLFFLFFFILWPLIGPQTA